MQLINIRMLLCIREKRGERCSTSRIDCKRKKNQSVVLLLINLPLNITANLNSPVLHKWFLGNNCVYVFLYLSQFVFFLLLRHIFKSRYLHADNVIVFILSI